MNNLIEAIGNTPLVELEQMSSNPNVRILVKLEYFNPGGSIKDRIVRHIIADAEERGLLKPGGVIVENTSGNTGAAVAMIAAMKGYKAILVMPDKVSAEKQDALKAYGAEIVMAPTAAPPDSPDHYEKVASRIAEETPNSFKLDQYDNPKNPEAHYLTTGPEIWEQTGGELTHFVASGSTGGTISGIGRFLKEKNPSIEIYMPDPIGSVYYEYFKTGVAPNLGGCTYQVEGIGEDHVTKAMDFSVVDEMWQFGDREAFLTARRLAREEGIMGGGSTGANVWGALKLASMLEAPATIVTIAPDSGVKYLSKIYNDEWMKRHDLLDA
jgi:cystathionine beta-synthase/cysteine synthase A